MEKSWLVTGSGSGLGRAIVEAVLAKGEHVLAGARKTDELQDLIERFGDRITPFDLDVRDEAAARSAVQRAVELRGRLDVLVNNACYQLNAPFEQISTEEFQDVVQTCFFGAVYTSRGAVPVMRKQKTGYIFQVSSIGGRVTIPGNSPYHAAKWALGGFSDSIADELLPFGVKVCTLEPGGIRTDFANRASKRLPDLMADYETSVGPTYEMLRSEEGKSENDPRRIAECILKLSEMNDVPKRLILGKAAESFVERAEKERAEEAVRYRDLTLSTIYADR